MNDLIDRGNLTAMSSVEETKKIAEVQAKMILARQFPRNYESLQKVIALECKNPALAEKAVYEFPRGDSVVRGASIRLVECVARHYGNILCGVEEIASTANGATVRAYAWDLESNFVDEKTFDVAYIRTTKNGSYPLTDPRDKYEMLANQGARRKRACIQAVIPTFVVDEAVEACQKTLEEQMNKGKEKIEDRRENVATAFAQIADWITKDVLSEYVGKEFDKFSVQDILRLGRLYNAIKDGFVKPETAFKREADVPIGDKEQGTLDALNGQFGGDHDGTDKG